MESRPLSVRAFLDLGRQFSMRFRRSDDRRRRVLMDDSAGDTEGTKSRGKRGKDVRNQRNYSEAARADRQRPITDLVPARRWSMSVVLLAILTCWSAVVSLHVHFAMADRPNEWIRADALALGKAGTLAAWYGTTIWLVAAIYAAITFALRRYKTNDYKGRYRLWIWVTPLFVLLSVDYNTHLLRDLLGPLAMMLGEQLQTAPHVVRMIAIILAATLLCGRLMIEMASSRLSATCLIVALACYVFGPLLAHQMIPVEIGPLADFYMAAMLLFGHSALCVAVIAHVRYVYLDAQGILGASDAASEATSSGWLQRRREKRAKAKESAKKAEKSKSTTKKTTSTTNKRKQRTDLDIGSQGNDTKKTSGAANQAKKSSKQSKSNTPTISRDSVSQPAADGDDDASENEAPLSKAARRRLRKQQRRGNRAA